MTYPLKSHQRGQATTEYLFILVFIAILATQIARNFSGFFGSSLANFAHVLSGQLTIGVCRSNCFFDGFVNGAKEE